MHATWALWVMMQATPPEPATITACLAPAGATCPSVSTAVDALQLKDLFGVDIHALALAAQLNSEAFTLAPEWLVAEGTQAMSPSSTSTGLMAWWLERACQGAMSPKSGPWPFSKRLQLVQIPALQPKRCAIAPRICLLGCP